MRRGARSTSATRPREQCARGPRPPGRVPRGLPPGAQRPRVTASTPPAPRLCPGPRCGSRRGGGWPAPEGDGACPAPGAASPVRPDRAPLTGARPVRLAVRLAVRLRGPLPGPSRSGPGGAPRVLSLQLALQPFQALQRRLQGVLDGDEDVAQAGHLLARATRTASALPPALEVLNLLLWLLWMLRLFRPVWRSPSPHRDALSAHHRGARVSRPRGAGASRPGGRALPRAGAIMGDVWGAGLGGFGCLLAGAGNSTWRARGAR